MSAGTRIHAKPNQEQATIFKHLSLPFFYCPCPISQGLSLSKGSQPEIPWHCPSYLPKQSTSLEPWAIRQEDRTCVLERVSGAEDERDVDPGEVEVLAG